MIKKMKKNIAFLTILIFTFTFLPNYKARAISVKGELELNSSVECDDPSAVDIWKITLPEDGTLTVAGSPHDSFNLHDAKMNLSEPIAHANGDGDISFTVNLQQGTYYILYYTENDCKGYTISNTFKASTLINDFEPNDQASKALTLSLNQRKTGHLGYLRYWEDNWDESDWYKVQVTTEGKLDIEVTTTDHLETDLIIYDENILKDPSGPHEVLYNDLAGNPKISINLKPGTYYLNLFRSNTDDDDFWDDYGEYTITSKFTPMPGNNDLEPNDFAATAIPLGINDSKTGYIGHVSYHKDDDNNFGRDMVDWYKVQVLSNGSLTVTVNTAQTLYADLMLLGSDGIEVIERDTRTGTLSNIEKYLEPGTYYLKVYPYGYYTSNSGMYTITTKFDSENTGGAKELKINSNVESDLPNETSLELWYITLPKDGTLTVSLPEEQRVSLLDVDGITYVEKQINDTESTATANLKAGTYYIEVDANYFPGKYLITNEFKPTSLENDREPNEQREDAILLGFDESKTGHLGYYSLEADYEDWYKVQVDVEGTFTAEVTTTDTLDAVMELNFADENLAFIERGQFTENTSKIQVNLKPGTYYVNLYVSDPGNSEKVYGEYTLKGTFEPKDIANNDVEPNDALTSALTLGFDDKKTGYIGHESYHVDSVSDKDMEDWYVVQIPSYGTFNINLNTSTSLIANVVLYDKDESIVVEDTNSEGSISNIQANLGPGTYYVKVYPSSEKIGSGNYTLTSSFIYQQKENDNEPNNERSKASLLNNNEEDRGHLGYYFNSTYDDLDWYKFEVTYNSLVKVKVTAESTLKSEVTLFDKEGIFIERNSSHQTELLVTKYLKPGAYYINTDRYSGYGGYTILQTQTIIDINRDNIVDIKDIAELAQNYNMNKNHADWKVEKDLNSDDIVDLYDLIIVAKGI